jgi:hypothetical protein
MRLQDGVCFQRIPSSDGISELSTAAHLMTLLKTPAWVGASCYTSHHVGCSTEEPGGACGGSGGSADGDPRGTAVALFGSTSPQGDEHALVIEVGGR